jgi:hypothetical protein
MYKQPQILIDAFEKLENTEKGTPEYNRRLKIYRDLNVVIEYARYDGLLQGFEEVKLKQGFIIRSERVIELVKLSRERGFSLERIAQSTGFSIEEIKAL